MSPQSLLVSSLNNLRSVSPSQGGEVTFCFPVYSRLPLLLWLVTKLLCTIKFCTQSQTNCKGNPKVKFATGLPTWAHTSACCS